MIPLHPVGNVEKGRTLASLVAQTVKNLPAIQETWVRALGWEDSSGEGTGYTFQYSCLAVTICSDFGAPKNKVSHCFPSICHEVMEPDAMILVF